MSAHVEGADLFERPAPFPDPEARRRFGALVGIDEHKERLVKLLGALLNPAGVERWAEKHHPDADGLLDVLLRRPPLIVLAGDVGSGKTELAETVGDAVARQQKMGVTLMPLSLATRGQGRVGEMTQLLSAAFDYAFTEAKKRMGDKGEVRGGVLLLIDEADAIAQSREDGQMHHEDRAGVNTLIRGVDRLAAARVPAAVIMCTNRLSALDPAVRRRAADVIAFGRPTDEQRTVVLQRALSNLEFSDAELAALVAATGERGRGYGFTFSDLTQRLVPAIFLDAFPDRAVTPGRSLEIAARMEPTPPFRDGRSGEG